MKVILLTNFKNGMHADLCALTQATALNDSNLNVYIGGGGSGVNKC